LQKTASQLAEFHRQLPAKTGITPDTAAEQASASVLNNFLHFEGSHISEESSLQIDGIETWTRNQAELLTPAFKQRAANGFIRDCHDDLHLANLFEQDGCIFPYDSLEFNPELRWIDQVSDIAFLVTDLMVRGRTDLAYAFLNTWLEESGDYDGLAVLRFYLVYRCMVRLKVASIQTRHLNEGVQGAHAIKARRYLALAQMLMNPPEHPLLVLMHGFSASGKTRTSGNLMLELPAIRIRSDLERKRLQGLQRHQHSDATIDTGIYSSASTEQTYMTVAAYCETGLKTGFNMVTDATFGKRKWRSLFLAMANRLGARPTIMQCSAPLDVLKSRIRQRTTDGLDESDADLAVLEHQPTSFEPLDREGHQLVIKDVTDFMAAESTLHL